MLLMRKQSWMRLAALVCALLLFMTSAFAQDAETVPPALPDGTEADGQRPEGEPPALPDGASPDGEAPAPPDGDGGMPPEGEMGSAPDGPMGSGGFGGSGEVTQGTAAATLDKDTTVSGGAFSSAEENENALRVTGASVSLTDITIQKSSGDTSNTEDSDFYGQNAGLLATDGADVTLTDSGVITNASGANAVFSYGTGTSVTVSDTVIRTEKNNSGGVHVAGGGTLAASNLDVETQGSSAAAIRSDRGGGTLTVDGGSYVTNGTGSPAIYSTAEVSVSNAALTANHSEAVVVEGKNSVALYDCTVSGSMDGTYGGQSGENIHGVMIYQSMSGDADVGQSRFSMTGGTLTTLQGDLIYVTNTSCGIDLSGVELGLANGCLLRVEGNDGSRGWGTVGANGGSCVLTADGQTLEGLIEVDEVSTLDITLQNASSFSGAINPEGEGGEVHVILEEGSTWTLTADSYVTSFTGSMDDVTLNGFTLHTAQ